jgi:hypothetical protein
MNNRADQQAANQGCERVITRSCAGTEVHVAIFHEKTSRGLKVAAFVDLDQDTGNYLMLQNVPMVLQNNIDRWNEIHQELLALGVQLATMPPANLICVPTAVRL